MRTTVVALGGNTLLRGGRGDADEQRESVAAAADHIARLHAGDRRVVVTHGNGPQVGNRLLQQEAASDVPAMPLDVLVAETQAQIGYHLQQALDERVAGTAATLVTQAVVDADDPAFHDPTKPVGPFYDESEAVDAPFETMAVDAPDGGRAYRRVVPSPEPREIVETDRVAALLEDDAPVVCTGGGGAPVVRTDGGLRGVEAVVDKDLASEVLGAALGAEELLVLTDVDHAYVNFGQPDQRALESVTADELRSHLAGGEFGTGSMRPKVEACVRFVEGGGERAVVTTPENAERALAGETGTRVTGAGSG